MTLPYLNTYMKGADILDLEIRYAFNDETKYHEELTSLVMDKLRDMFGDDVPDPVEVIFSKWNADEFSHGVYSFNKVGTVDDHRRNLKYPINDTVFFAGEHTSIYHYGTIHGAYWSGIATADRVLASLYGYNETNYTAYYDD